MKLLYLNVLQMCKMSVFVLAAAASDAFRADFFFETERGGFSEAMMNAEFWCGLRLSKGGVRCSVPVGFGLNGGCFQSDH